MRAVQPRPLTAAQQNLARENIGLVYRVADRVMRAWTLPYGWDREDVVSACWMGYLSACRKYDPERNVKFSTLAVLCCQRTLSREVKLALDRTAHQIEGEADLPAKEYAPACDNREVIGVLMARGRQLLTPHEDRVFLGLTEGLQRRQIAARLGVSLESVRQAKCRIARRLRLLLS